MHTLSIEPSTARQGLAKDTDTILMCLVAASDPVKAILRHYDAAEDKDAFVFALAGTLLLRHRQWQAAHGKAGE